MKVVVAGGSGFIGRALVRELGDRGDKVVVLSRGPGRDEGPVRTVHWTPGEAGPWEAELLGADAVLNLAGEPVADARWTDARKREIEQSRVESSRGIADVLARGGHRVKVFVNVSAVGFYGNHHGDAPVDESTPPGDDFLARVCVAREAAAEPARRGIVRVCHARMGVVLGPDGGVLAKMVPPFRAFVGGPLGDGKQPIPWVHRRDAVRALVFAIDHAELDGPFNVTAPEPATMNELARTLGLVLGRPAAIRVPGAALKLALGEAADVVLKGQRALPKRLVELGFAFVFPDLKSALADAVDGVRLAS